MFEITTSIDNVTDAKPIIIGEQVLPVSVIATECTPDGGLHRVFNARFGERDVTLILDDGDGWTLVLTINRADRSIIINSDDAYASSPSIIETAT